MANNFRQLFKWLTPSWLREGDGELILHSLAVITDAFMDRIEQGHNARFPTRAPETALALHEAQRGILRGRSESAAAFAARLVTWRYPKMHRVRGNAFALLEQVVSYFGGACNAYTIDVRGNRHDRSAAGVESYSYGNTWNWDGAAATPNWARFWVVVKGTGASAQPVWGDASLWGNGAYGNTDQCFGMQGVTPTDVLKIRNLVRTRPVWKPAGTRGEWLIISLDGSSPVPDGTWGDWADGGRAAATNFRFCGLNL